MRSDITAMQHSTMALLLCIGAVFGAAIGWHEVTVSEHVAAAAVAEAVAARKSLEACLGQRDAEHGRAVGFEQQLAQEQAIEQQIEAARERAGLPALPTSAQSVPAGGAVVIPPGYIPPQIDGWGPITAVRLPPATPPAVCDEAEAAKLLREAIAGGMVGKILAAAEAVNCANAKRQQEHRP